jgi:hypothetical protein
MSQTPDTASAAAVPDSAPLPAKSSIKGWLPDSFVWNASVGAGIGASLAMVFWIASWIFKFTAGPGDMIILIVNLMLASFTVVSVVGHTDETHFNRSRMLAGLSALCAMLLGYAFWAHRVIGFLDFPHDSERDLALEQFKKLGISIWLPSLIGMASFGFYYVIQQLKSQSVVIKDTVKDPTTTLVQEVLPTQPLVNPPLPAPPKPPPVIDPPPPPLPREPVLDDVD